MQEIFGTSWISQFGTTPNRTWIEVLAQLTDAQIVNGLRRTVDEAREFPPNLPTFYALCVHEPPQPEYAPYHKLIESDPPESEEHRKERIKRNREGLARVRAALRGRA